MPLCFPPSLRVAVDMQPSPRGFSSPQGPSPKLLCAGQAPKPLPRMSAQCWSLDENLSCSPQHNVAIIAPIQEDDTCLLVHSGPRKADRDLRGSCWEKEFHGWMKTPSFVIPSISAPGQGLLPAPRLQGLVSVVNSGYCTGCIWRKRNFCFHVQMLHEAHPLLLGPSSRKEHPWLHK